MFEIYSTCLLQNFPFLFREACLFFFSYSFMFVNYVNYVFVFARKAMLRKRTVLKRCNVKSAHAFVSWCWLPDSSHLYMVL